MTSSRQRHKPVTRTPAQVREHYEIEKQLAIRLMEASSADRKHLYSKLYDELFRLVPHHPQLIRKSLQDQRKKDVAYQMQFLDRYLTSASTFLEIGAGDCALVTEVCRRVSRGLGLEVSSTIIANNNWPKNFELLISDGTSVPLPQNSVDLAYSNQLMEHLHPDDAFEQLKNIHACLRSGGIYVCITPPRLSGPHDVSRAFDRIATGLHLKEYDVSEIRDLFRRAGFRKVRMLVGVRGLYIETGTALTRLLETVLKNLPYGIQRRIACAPLIWGLIYPRVIGIK